LTSTLTAAPSLSPADQVSVLQQRVRTLVRQGLVLHEVPPDVDPPPLQLRNGTRYGPCLQGRGDRTVKSCTFGAKSRQTLVVLGDSQGMTWMPAIDIYAKQAGYRVVTVFKNACPVPSIDVFKYPECPPWREHALQYIRTLKPAAVILVFSLEPNAEGKISIPEWRAGLRESLRTLRRTHALIVEIGGNNARMPQEPGLCLTRPGADPSACTGSVVLHAVREAEGALVRDFGGTFIDIEPWLCVDGRCPVIIDKRIVYRDRGHMTPQFVSDLEPLLAASLRIAGLR
jgi:hypothetical protein